MAITVTQIWRRNAPSTISGESLTVTVTYSSFKKEEIDGLESKMPNGVIQTKLSTARELSEYFDDLATK